jgi:glycosyltransferase involved in cell wall biosynthesis
MKILIIVNTLHHGGAERQAVIDANALTCRGHQVTIGYNKKGDLINLLSDDVKKYHIKPKNVFLAMPGLFLHLFLNKYDIIHCHMFWAEKVCAIPGKITGHKVIFNEHGLGLWRKWYHILIMRFISQFADKIITSCQTNKNTRVNREKLNKNKIVTIYNSFDTINSEDNESERPDFLMDGKKFTIGFVGRFNAVKRLRTFIEIAEQLKNIISDFRIVLVGGGEERRDIEEEIAKRNLKKYFHFPGFVLNTGQYYKNFDVFILPSRIEAFSIALLEAGSFGVPAIAFNVGGNCEIIQDGVTGYIISDNDFGQLLEKINYLYKNHDKRIKMGTAAQDLIKKKFSILKRLNELENIYNKLCYDIVL